jgi:hypothetical protein
LFTPEVDPQILYSQLTASLTGKKVAMAEFSRVLDYAATHRSATHGHQNLPYIHWSGLGGFRELSDSERQFLLLKSLFLFGPQKGGILIELKDYLEMTPGFKNRMDWIVQSLQQGVLTEKVTVASLIPQLWSSGGSSGTQTSSSLLSEISHQVQAQSMVTSSIDFLLSQRDVRLIFIDAEWILTEDLLNRLLTWVREGNVLVLPKTPILTEPAHREFDDLVYSGRPIDMDMGARVKIHTAGNGKVVFFPPDVNAKKFVKSCLNLAEILVPVQMSDSRLQTACIQYTPAMQEEQTALFVLNPTAKNIEADMIFDRDVAIKDLALTMQIQLPVTPDEPLEDSQAAEKARRFHLAVPPNGVLPLIVEGLVAVPELTPVSAEDKNSVLPDLEHFKDESVWN